MIRRVKLASLLGAVILGATLLACSGDDDDSPPAAASATAVSEPTSAPAATVPAATATPVAAGLAQQSLVYIDRRKPGPAEIWVADATGGNPKLVTSTTTLRRTLDLSGKTLVATGQGELQFIDLTTGQTRLLSEQVFENDGRFVSPQTFVYITTGGCAGGGQLESSVYKVDVATLQLTPLLKSPANLQVAGFDATSLALTPRGCDPAVTKIDVYSLANGQAMRSVPIEGCGWAGIDLAQQKAAASWKSCTPPANHAQDDVTVVEFRVTPPAARYVSNTPSDPNTWPLLLRPGSNQLAMGLTRIEGTGPGSVRGGGIWLLNLETLAFDQIQPPDGAEQYVLDWTEDGRHALTATVEAMGLCNFAAVDATTKQATKVNAEITVCGANGEVVGWTVLR
jgi:hypothetical protein